MICLTNFISFAAATNTTIGYPEESLYNKKDSNLVPLENGMDLSRKTLYFNTNWKLSDYCRPDDVFTLIVAIVNERNSQNGEFTFEVTDETFASLTLNIDNLYYVFLGENDWYMSSFTFPNGTYIVSDVSFELTVDVFKEGGSTEQVTIPLSDLVLVTKEEGQLISTESTNDYGCKSDVDIMTILIYGALICMAIFIISHIKR